MSNKIHVFFWGLPAVLQSDGLVRKVGEGRMDIYISEFEFLSQDVEHV